MKGVFQKQSLVWINNFQLAIMLFLELIVLYLSMCITTRASIPVDFWGDVIIGLGKAM